MEKEERNVYKIGVISDTHGLLREEVTKQLLECDAILHAGDFDNIKVWERLHEIGTLYAVKGNNDHALGNMVPNSLSFTLYGIRFFMVHNKDDIPAKLKDTDVVIFGHSHMYDMYYEGETLFLNPGSCGKKRFRLPLTMAVLEVKEDSKEVQVKKISILEEKVDKDISNRLRQFQARDMRKVVKGVIRDMEKGKDTDSICKRRKIDRELAEQIQRIYVTHPGVDVDGILNRMEIAGL